MLAPIFRAFLEKKQAKKKKYFGFSMFSCGKILIFKLKFVSKQPLVSKFFLNEFISFLCGHTFKYSIVPTSVLGRSSFDSVPVKIQLLIFFNFFFYVHTFADVYLCLCMLSIYLILPMH